MSTPTHSSERIERLPVTLPQLAERKRLAQPIVMVTAYDFPSAQVAETAGVDIVLVGDTGAMTVLGYPSTVPVSVAVLGPVTVWPRVTAVGTLPVVKWETVSGCTLSPAASPARSQ